MGEDWVRPVVHFQIEALDVARQSEFYRRMFDWDGGEDGLRPFAPGIGGPAAGVGGHIRAAAEPGISLWVQVRDIQASAELAGKLGGRVKRPPVLSGGVTMAFIEDPEGNGIGLIQQ